MRQRLILSSSIKTVGIGTFPLWEVAGLHWAIPSVTLDNSYEIDIHFNFATSPCQ